MSKKNTTAVSANAEVTTAEATPVATATVKTPNRYDIRKTALDELNKEFHAQVSSLRNDIEARKQQHKKWLAEVYEPRRAKILADFEASKKVIVIKKEEVAEAPAKVEA